jgi:hypothetical protein
LDIVKYMNRWLCIIRRATGKPNIIEEYSRLEKQSVGPGHDVVTMFTLRSPSDACAAYKKHTFLIAGDKPRTPMDIWLSSPESREYDSIDFIPAGCDDKSVFNLFRGLAITRDAAAACEFDVTPIIEHVLKIWCKGDQRVADFLFDWMAHLIQKPGVKMTSAPVLKGGQGAGKGIVIQKLGDILGAEHFLGVRSIDSVTGSFQEDKVKTNLVTFLDECTFAGDKKQSSVLKGLISETKRRWEAKFVNPVRIANHSNYIVASNYDQIVYVEEDDRRWFCIEVDSKYAGPQTAESKAYFDTLAAVPAVAFAKFLYERDISAFNSRAPPSGNYMRHQKAINFGSVTGFCESALRAGRFAELEPLAELQVDEEDEMVAPVLKSAVYEAYLDFCRGRGIRRTVIDKAFWRKMKSLLPGIQEFRGPREMGRQRMLRFPSVEEGRAMFVAAIHEKDWDWDECGDDQ